MWTRFMDMHSGGSTKEPPYEYIYIEAPEDEARVIFYNRFGHNPGRVTCTCCGEDYSVGSADDLAQATAFERGCASRVTLPDGSEAFEVPIELWRSMTREQRIAVNQTFRYVEEPCGKGYREYQTLDEYRKRSDVLIIPADQIKPEERTGSVPAQGYVWVD